METTIEKLFDSKNRKFEIPSYQRSYSWEKKQINQFLEDLSNAGNHYYLGHFLFEMKDTDGNTLLVIDGQQRLTTCVIFFASVRNELLKRKLTGESVSKDVEDIKDYYLRDLRKETQKFCTVLDDNNFFVQEIVDWNIEHYILANTTSKLRIKAAKQLFAESLAEQPTATLEKWCGLVEQATVTQYVVKNKVQATQIFAFQNDRGKKLSNLEVLKAYFMLQIYLSDKNVSRMEEHINFLEIELSLIYKQIVRIDLDEDEVLNYYWRASSGKGFYSDEVISGVKESLGKVEDRLGWIQNFVSGLSHAFQTIETVEQSSESYTKDLRYLNNMALVYPFLIKAYRFKTPEKQLNRLIRLLENLVFRYLLRGGRAEIESRLNHFLVVYSSASQTDNIIDEIINNIKHNGWWSYWNDWSMRDYLKGYFYKNRVDNYVLWKYELYISDPEHPSPHNVSFHELIKNESIEHIAPQTPTDGKPLANGYGAYKDDVMPENGIVSGDWLNKVGNLMLISRKHNSEIGNKPFFRKVTSYGEENLLNQQKEVISYCENQQQPIWDVPAIKKRQEKILKAATVIWNLNNI